MTEYRFLADENFESPIFNGLLLRIPELDIIRVQEHGLVQTDDRIILAWAAQENRIVLTHDLRTMIPFAYERVADELFMPGMFAMPHTIKPGTAIDDLEMIMACSEPEEWHDRVVRLPYE